MLAWLKKRGFLGKFNHYGGGGGDGVEHIKEYPISQAE